MLKDARGEIDEEKSDFSSLLRVNLRENRVVSFQLHEKADPGVKKRLRDNQDYRQGMLAYVLANLNEGDKERVIQTLMPERLNAQLNFQNKVICEYHEIRKDDMIFIHMEITRDEANPEEVLIAVKVKAEDAWKKKEYVVGSSKVLLMGDLSSVEKVLRTDFELISIAEAAGAEQILKEQWDTIAAVILDADCAETEYVAEMIRENDRYRSIPVVIFAGSADVAEAYILHSKAAEFILSTDTPEIQKHRIRTVVQRHDLAETVKCLERDTLTGVYNKESFYRYSEPIMRRDEEYELILVQISNIRAIQGKYGDTITGMVNSFVVSHLRKELPGVSLIGRFSDSEYVVLRLRNISCDYDRILTDIRNHAPAHNLALKAGIVYAEKTDTVRLLCERAVRVIGSITETYGVHWAVYDDNMKQNDRKVQMILGSMETALEQGLFDVYFQPKHCTLTGNVCGAEALVRWNHPEFGFLNPREFIPLFERVGFIRGLDRYIFARVCRTLLRWNAMGLPMVPVSVNLSRRDFETEDLADWILDLTKRMHIDPQWIHIEVTETAYTDNPKQISICLHRLHEAGFSIELDDFGVGYSSLTILNDIDVDILKIDRSIIVKDVPGEEKSILEFCMQLAKIMKLKTVAEGVETEAQKNRICELGCDYIQGFYYAHPMPEQEFETYLRRHAAAK